MTGAGTAASYPGATTPAKASAPPAEPVGEKVVAPPISPSPPPDAAITGTVMSAIRKKV